MGTIRAAHLFLRNRSTVELREVFVDRLPKMCMGVAGMGGVYQLYRTAPYGAEHHVLQEKLKVLYRDDQVSLVAQAVHSWWTKDYVLWLFTTMREQLDVKCWTSIVLVTLCLRMALVPVYIQLLRNSLRMKVILPELEQHAVWLKDKHLSEHVRLEHARSLHHLLRKHKCNPWSHLITFPILLPPIILSVFGAVSEMCLTEPRMETDGVLWFPDLIERDETQLLAIISALTWLWNVEIGAGVHYSTHRTLRNSVRLGAVSFISLSSTLPAGVFVFWITSNVFALARGYILRGDAVRKYLHIPTQKTIAGLTHLPKYQ